MDIREALGSWLSGSQAVSTQIPVSYKGESFGLPPTGHGSVASSIRRACALVIDWMACVCLGVLITGSTMTSSTVTLVLWWSICSLSVWLWSRTPGQIICGICVANVRSSDRVGLGQALIRQSLLLPLLIPAFFLDHDGRGLHDRATGTIVLCS